MPKRDVHIGKGKLDGKGVYASRDFKEGEVVKFYDLKQLTQKEFDALPAREHKFVHSFGGKMYLFPEPSRYTNHSPKPNTHADFKKMCDIASGAIRKGEMITTNAKLEVKFELESFIKVYEKTKNITGFKVLSGGYRNATVSYALPNGRKGNSNCVESKAIGRS